MLKYHSPRRFPVRTRIVSSNISYKSFFIAGLGTMLEYYDFALFAIFLPIIAPVFFPARSSYESLMKAYVVLMIAMIMRPLGGIVFGYVGDLWGRRRALLISMYGIALATIMLGLIPPYKSIGIVAIILVLIAKSIQMLCFGGEYNGAGIYAVEHATKAYEGVFGGMLTATTLLGALLASLAGVLCTAEGAPTWAWRAAFIGGGIVGVAGILFRSKMHESPQFKPANLVQHSFAKMLKKYPQQLFAGVMLGGLATVPFTTVIVFINPALVKAHIITVQQMMEMQAILIGVAIAVVIRAGRLADQISPKFVMQMGAIALVVFAYPLLHLINSHSYTIILTAEIALIAINEIVLGPSNAYLKNLFATEYRYRATSFSFCIGLSIIGGVTPVLENYLHRLTKEFSILSVWLILIAAGTFVAIKIAERKESAQAALSTSAYQA